MNRAVVAVAVVAVICGSIAAYWMVGEQQPVADAAGERSGGGQGPEALKDWRAALKTSGLDASLSAVPDESNASLRTAAASAGDAAGIAALLQKKVAAGDLREMSRTRMRHHPMRTAAQLWTELAKGKARPVHTVELAWLTAAMLQAQKLPLQFVQDGAALATPLLLTRTLIGVRSGSVVIAPLAKLQSPQPIDEAHAASWWLIQRAYTERANKRFKQAHSLLAAAANLGFDNHAAAFARGVVQLDQGLVERGLERCSAALTKEDDPIARLFLAEVLNQLERPFKAWQQVETVLKSHPELAEAHASKGIIDAGRVATVPQKDRPAKLSQAEAALRKALELDSDVPGARAGLAQVLMLQGKTEDAEAMLVQAVDTQHDAAAAALLAELWTTTGKTAELVAKLEPLATGDDPRIAAALVRAYGAADQTDKALALADKALAAEPGDTALAMLRVDLLRKTGKLDEAAAALGELRKAGGPEAEQLALMQAQLLLQQNKPDAAIALLVPLSRRPGARDATMLLLMAYKIGQKAMEADALIVTAISKGTLKPLEIAGALVESGDTQGATKVLEDAMKAQTPDPAAASMLAMIYTASGDKKAAEALRDGLVARKPANADELRKSIDEAIAGATEEMAAIQKEEAAERAGDAEKAAAPAHE